MTRNFKDNIIVIFIGLVLSALLVFISKKYLDGIAVKVLGLCSITYLMAFILKKIPLLIYILLTSLILVFGDGYNRDEVINYIPFIVELFAGGFIISFLKDVFKNNELVSTFFGVIIGRLAFFVSGFILYDLILERSIFNTFLLDNLNEQVIGVILTTILVPLICYGIKKNTIIWNWFRRY